VGVDAGVGGSVASAGDVGGGDVGVCDVSVGIVMGSVSVDVALGVGGFTPELGVGVGRGDVGSYAGTLFTMKVALMKTTRAKATKTKTMTHALIARIVAVSCSIVNRARLRSR
jgi:hypothetical protein